MKKAILALSILSLTACNSGKRESFNEVKANFWRNDHDVDVLLSVRNKIIDADARDIILNEVDKKLDSMVIYSDMLRDNF